MVGLTDREQLVELLARYASIPDTRDFDELPKTVFTDRVIWDFESVGAGPPIEIERDVFMQQLRTFFADWQADAPLDHQPSGRRRRRRRLDPGAHPCPALASPRCSTATSQPLVGRRLLRRRGGANF